MLASSRLVEGTVLTAGPGRLLRLASGWLSITATAASIYVAADLIAPLSGTAGPSLGLMLTEAAAGYDVRAWPFVPPAVATALLLASLLYMATAVAVPTPVPADEPQVNEESVLFGAAGVDAKQPCLLYTSPSPRDS